MFISLTWARHLHLSGIHGHVSLCPNSFSQPGLWNFLHFSFWQNSCPLWKCLSIEWIFHNSFVHTLVNASLVGFIDDLFCYYKCCCSEYSRACLLMHTCLCFVGCMLRGGLPGWLSGKESACQCGSRGFSPGSARSPGEGNGNPFQYSCLEIPWTRGAWWATVLAVAKSQTRLSD